MLDPEMSGAEFGNDKLRHRRSKDRISIQFYATRTIPFLLRSSLLMTLASMLSVFVFDP